MQLTKPKMVIFDAGRTLMNYKEINIRKGIEAYFPYIISNPHNYSIEEIEKQDDEIFDLCRENRFEIPVKNKLRLLFDLLEIQLSISLDEVAKIEWEEDPVIETVNHAADLLHWLNGAKIRTAVISNCDYSGNLLQEKLNKIFPENQFEFVIASSDYGVMKPNRYIFQAGIVKSGLEAKDIWYVGDKVELGEK
ncbi:HAD family hydrolase [Roseburia inulinivorans]|uniref:HAD family hydrolase n=1 Tax=Roseburia inulinivorans TaxID=360807 RepID=UPI003FEF8432